MIAIIWDTIEHFIENWSDSPFEWQTEIDIQVEIASRLRQAFKDRKQLIQKARYGYIRKGQLQEYSRVCCEWSTNYNDSSGKRYFCKPDIIVYDDIADSNNPPDLDREKNWPMLWVCEIKYQTEDNSPQYKEWDTEKIKYLLEQNETKFACRLYFNRKEIDKNPLKASEEMNGRFRSYTVLPKN